MAKIYPKKDERFGAFTATGRWKINRRSSKESYMMFEVRCPHGAVRFLRASKLRTGESRFCNRWSKCPLFRLSTTPEYRTVILHFDCIKSGLSGYKDMPFYRGWLPKRVKTRTRMFETAALWIIKNLGHRPKGCSIHVVDHEKGFAPGNLEWTYPRKQANQQMYKIIAQLKHRIKELESKLRSR